MKKQYSVISFLFGMLVLSALLVQAMHAVHHLKEAFAEKKCHHDYAKSGSEITHGHHDLDHCFVCEFTFANATSPTFYSFEYQKSIHNTSYSFCYSKEIIQSFRGSLFALRAPPIFIV